MKKFLLIPFFITSIVFSIKSQVSIGELATEPDPNAILDLQSSQRGFLLPRLQLSGTDKATPMASHIAGMSVYNTATVNSGYTSVSPGLYYNDGSRWIRMVPQNTIFFYAPSIVVPIDVTDPAYNPADQSFTINLYSVYSSQFSLSDGSSSVKSPSASSLPIQANNQLDYFVTYYDNSVFTDVAISDVGILTYKLKSNYAITEKTFFNVVFKIK